ncbi:hypothetical protein KW842_10200 [Duganella sp. sic0402]|uniref:hypothetical protein n=1 Tax=Duganella sp. sic0402 TaxID=2854786 RepID=UPI001C48AEEC|nr:hypothetical protein [Duganella sp. sic0402]MBV7536136.1 hypothetical protein [Duganella sp. sic0402]
MIELFFSELRRFRNAAIIYFLASLVAVTVLNQLIDIAAAQLPAHMVMLLLYALSGLGFGLYQFGSYCQPSRWIWLQHRPLHRARILAGIALASCVLIVLAVALPLFIVLGAQDYFTQRVVDTRHYAGIAYLTLSALSAWMAGAYIMLHRSRWAFVILVLPVLLTMHLTRFEVMLGLALVCNAALVFLVYTVFRPNRHTGGDLPATCALAVPLQLSFYIALLWASSALFQAGQMVAGAHPLAPEPVVAGGVAEARRSDSREILLAGLGGAADPRAAGWRSNLGARNTSFVGPTVRQYAVNKLVSTRGVLQFQDRLQNNWTFSHDSMLYSGQHRPTGAAVGWFGAGGRGDAVPFDSQPAPMSANGRGYLVNAHDMYELQKDGLHLRQLMHVGAAEQLGGGVAVLANRTALLTNHRVVLLEDRGGWQSAPLAEVPLPALFGDIVRVDAAQVSDGTLLSVVAGHRRNDGVMAAPQVTYLVDAAGKVTELGRRELAHDFPALFEHKDWWLSPALQAVVSLPELFLDTGVVPDHGASRLALLMLPRPASAWLAMIALAILSGAGAAWWTSRVKMTPRVRIAWCAACVLLGCPALLSLMVLQPRLSRPEVASVPAAGLTTLAAGPA